MKLESLTEKELQKDSEILTARTIWVEYCAVKEHLCTDTLPNIAKHEPHLTDHSETHIKDVQRQILKIIETRLDMFNAIELYFLCYASLIHDIGNIFGREGHEERAMQFIKKFPIATPEVKRISNRIAKAHGGKGDTIGKMEPTTSYDNNEVKSREIASIVRFADECAEGVQRCYQFGLEHDLIDPDSVIFHQYAKSSTVFINVSDIQLEYHVALTTFKTIIDFEKFLKFMFKRINKMQRERLYCSQYSKIISEYKEIKVTIKLALDDTEEPFETFAFILNNLTMLDCTNDPCNTEKRMEKILQNSIVKAHYKIGDQG